MPALILHDLRIKLIQLLAVFVEEVVALMLHILKQISHELELFVEVFMLFFQLYLYLLDLLRMLLIHHMSLPLGILCRKLL